MFRLLPIVVGLFEMPFYFKDRTPDLEKLAKLYERYFREGFGHELHGGKIQIARVLPPKEGTPVEQVMPFEDVAKVLEILSQTEREGLVHVTSNVQGEPHSHRARRRASAATVVTPPVGVGIGTHRCTAPGLCARDSGGTNGGHPGRSESY